MSDMYCYEDSNVLRNKLDIRSGDTLDLLEAEQSRVNMMLLYEQGICDFSPAGVQFIHHFLFGDIYEWAGQFRTINIQKREMLLAGRSVWYSSENDISADLKLACDSLAQFNWAGCSKEQFVAALVKRFPPIWQAHPFREGNTRTVVMMMTLFVEHHGFFMDKDLLAASAGYVRDSFVMASLEQNSEFKHLEKILLDAVCLKPIIYDEHALEPKPERETHKYGKYQKEPYIPQPHELRVEHGER